MSGPAPGFRLLGPERAEGRWAPPTPIISQELSLLLLSSELLARALARLWRAAWRAPELPPADMFEGIPPPARLQKSVQLAAAARPAKLKGGRPSIRFRAMSAASADSPPLAPRTAGAPPPLTSWELLRHTLQKLTPAKTPAMVALITTADRSLADKTFVSARILEQCFAGAQDQVPVIVSADNVEQAAAITGASCLDMSMVVVSPHSTAQARTAAALQSIWGVDYPDLASRPGAYHFIDLRHSCGRKLGSSCAGCRKEVREGLRAE